MRPQFAKREGCHCISQHSSIQSPRAMACAKSPLRVLENRFALHHPQSPAASSRSRQHR